MERRSPKASEEEYLKTILLLTAGKKSARTRDIAKALKIAPASVTEMLEKLAKKGRISHSPYHGVALTAGGRRIAEVVLRRYRLLERFFTEYLGVPPAEATRQACLIEHCISKETERRICQAMMHPEVGMDNRPMPKCRVAKSCDECMRDYPPLPKNAFSWHPRPVK